MGLGLSLIVKFNFKAVLSTKEVLWQVCEFYVVSSSQNVGSLRQKSMQQKAFV